MLRPITSITVFQRQLERLRAETPGVRGAAIMCVICSIFMTTIMYNHRSGGVAGTHRRGAASKGGDGRM